MEGKTVTDTANPWRLTVETDLIGSVTSRPRIYSPDSDVKCRLYRIPVILIILMYGYKRNVHHQLNMTGSGKGKALYVLTRLYITRGFQDACTSHASEDIWPSALLAVPFRYQRNYIVLYSWLCELRKDKLNAYTRVFTGKLKFAHLSKRLPHLWKSRFHCPLSNSPPPPH